MQRAYEQYLSLTDKLGSLARHRALRSDDGDKLAGTYNRFVSRIAQEVSEMKATPGVIVEEAPDLREFIEG